MGEFRGYKCDSCGTLIDAENRTRKTVRYEGNLISGDYTQDLCPECIPAASTIELRPIQRRPRKQKDGVPEQGPGQRVLAVTDGTYPTVQEVSTS